jgi:hypothetical protein
VAQRYGGAAQQSLADDKCVRACMLFGSVRFRSVPFGSVRACFPSVRAFAPAGMRAC